MPTDVAAILPDLLHRIEVRTQLTNGTRGTVALLLLLASPPAAHAGTPRTSAAPAAGLEFVSSTAAIENVPVCAAPHDQFALTSVPDGQGGTIVVWCDYRSGEYDIYAQRIDRSGIPRWALDGVPVCKAPGAQSRPVAVADGAGGAIVVWQDARAADLDVYAQRVTASGSNAWPNGGIALAAAALDQSATSLVSDESGGAIAVWRDGRSGQDAIVAQRVDPNGFLRWSADGVTLCGAAGAPQRFDACSDGLGGAWVVWEDKRSGELDLHHQRITAAGVPQGSASGDVLCAESGAQERPAITPDGTGGLIVAWSDSRSGPPDVYAQRLSPVGVPLWTASGVAICSADGVQQDVHLCADGSGGALIAWVDGRGVDRDLYARRIGAAGVLNWTSDGVLVTGATGDQDGLAMVGDAVGGATIAWSDARSAATLRDVYVQRLTLDGAMAWSAGGVLVCNSTGDQDGARLAADGDGGAVIAWVDRRSGTADVYSQRVGAYGQVPDQCTPPVTLSNGSAWSASAPHVYGTYEQLAFYWSGVGVRSANSDDWDLDLYRPGDPGAVDYPVCFGDPIIGSYGASGVDFVVTNFNPGHAPIGLYNVRASRYSGVGPGLLEWDEGEDEIAKDATNSGARRNSWSGVLDVYDLYLFAGRSYTFDFSRSGNGSLKLLLFPPGSSELGTPRSAAAFETQKRYTVYGAEVAGWYGVVVVNDNGAAGSYDLRVWSPQNTPTDASGPSPSRSAFVGVSPNPAAGTARLAFTLAAPAQVEFIVLDLAGRVAARIPGGRWEAGSWSVAWDGRVPGSTALPAGVYLVRMRADGAVIGEKRLARVR